MQTVLRDTVQAVSTNLGVAAPFLSAPLMATSSATPSLGVHGEIVFGEDDNGGFWL